MKIVEKPWGYEEIWAKTDNYVAKRLVINSGHRLSLQYHEKKEETIYVSSGCLRIWESENDDEYKDYTAGSVYHVIPGKIHRFGAPAGACDKTILMEVSTVEIDDVIRIKDDYQR